MRDMCLGILELSVVRETRRVVQQKNSFLRNYKGISRIPELFCRPWLKQKYYRKEL